MTDAVEPGRGSTRGSKAGSRRRSRRAKPHRTWPQRLIIAVNIVLVGVCLASAGGLAYAKRQVSEVRRVDLGGTLSEEGSASAVEPQNILMVGIDNDFGLDPNDPVLRGRDNTANTDTIMVLRIDPSLHKAWLLSFPRDLLVTIPGTGGKAKINSAMASAGGSAGIQKLIETIQTNFRIPIHHYVQVNLAGFEQLVNAIGGVPVYFDKPARDTHTGLAQLDAGCAVLDGTKALQYVRSRYYEVQTGPYRWESDPSSDIGRIRRQQEFIRAAMKKAINRGARDPRTLSELIGVGQRSVVVDSGMTARLLLDIGAEFRDFDPDSLEVLTPPAAGGWYGPAAVLFLQDQQAQPMFDIFRGVNPTLNIQRAVRFEVRNGNGVLGRGKQVADQMSAAGFTVLRYTDSPLYRSDKTVIKYASGADENQAKVNKFYAVVLARYLDVDATIEPDTSLTGDTPLALVVGNDYKGVRKDPRPLQDFRQYLPPEVVAQLDNQPATGASPSSTELQIATTTSSQPALVPTLPPGAEDCR